MAAKYHTVEEFIESNAGSKSINYYNFSILQQEEVSGETLQLLDMNIVDDYIDELQSVCVNVQLSDKELMKYSYNPGLLAYDIYGSTELEFVILKINGVIDHKDFNFPTIKLVEVSVLDDILSTIYSAESKFIRYNREVNGIEEV